jgi:hypothetical protein
MNWYSNQQSIKYPWTYLHDNTVNAAGITKERLNCERRSIRARDLFLNLHADVLPGFNEPRPWLEHGVWTAWLGYGEPFHPSVHYISMQ